MGITEGDVSWVTSGFTLFWRQYAGWLIPTLPFIERQQVYEMAKKIIDDGGNPATTVSATYPGGQPISALWCPSDRNAKSQLGEMCPSSYRACRGDMICSSGTNTPRGVYQRGDRALVTFANIVDGSSNTIMLAEGIVNNFTEKVGAAKIQYPARGGVALVAVSSGSAPSICIGAPRDPNDFNLLRDAVQPNSNNLMRMTGTLYTYGGWNTCINTAVPPNNPVCVNSSSDLIINPSEGTTFATVSSYHSGGINVAMADASVRFISDTVNAGDPSVSAGTATGNKYQNFIGPSPWGVWGALGSIAGGESITL